MKRTVALLLVLLAVLSLASCRELGKGPDETTAAEKETTVLDETEKAPATDKITEPETEPETEAETEEETTIADTTAVSEKMDEKKAVSIARDYLGDKDPDIGYAYSYQFVEITAEGDYKIKVSWYIEEDERYSTCGYLLISPEGKITKFDW